MESTPALAFNARLTPSPLPPTSPHVAALSTIPHLASMHCSHGMHPCMHARARAQTHTQTHTLARAYTLTHTRTCVGRTHETHTRTHTHTHARTHTHTRTHTHNMYVCMYIYLCVCVCVYCVHIYAYVYVYVMYMYIAKGACDQPQMRMLTGLALNYTHKSHAVLFWKHKDTRPRKMHECGQRPK
jgi:hypothetical protein